MSDYDKTAETKDTTGVSDLKDEGLLIPAEIRSFGRVFWGAGRKEDAGQQ